jgi:hypothetical protein
MEDKKNNILKIGLIALIGLNIFLLSNKYFNGNHPPNHERTDKFVIKELKLNDDQIKQYRILVNQHQDSIQKLINEGKKLRNNYFSLLKYDSINVILKNDYLFKIKSNQQQIEEITFNHFYELKRILNREQKIKFDDIIEEIVIKLSTQKRRPD